MILTTPQELADLFALRCESEVFGPFSGRAYLLVDLTLDAGADGAALVARLGALPCPVIGVGRENAALAAGCDVVIGDPARHQGMLANVSKNPIAAMVLAQVLRTSAGLPIEAGLRVESLAYATLQSGPEFAAYLMRRKRALHVGDPGPPVVISRDGGTMEILLNRPSSFNAITIEMRNALCEAFDLAALDDAVERVVLRGAGRCFSVGGSLAEFGSAPDGASAHAVRSLRLPAARMVACGKPVHARVHGACIGGGLELAAFAQRLTAEAGAFFQLPELGRGLIPGAGGTVSLVRRRGRLGAGGMMFGGNRISAHKAETLKVFD